MRRVPSEGPSISVTPFAENRALTKQIADGQRSASMNFDLRRTMCCLGCLFHGIVAAATRPCQVDIRFKLIPASLNTTTKSEWLQERRPSPSSAGSQPPVVPASRIIHFQAHDR